MSNIKTCPECGRQIFDGSKMVGIFCSESCSRNNYAANVKTVSDEEYEKIAYKQSIISVPIFWGFLGFFIGYKIDFKTTCVIAFIIIGLALRWKFKKIGIVFGKIDLALRRMLRYGRG